MTKSKRLERMSEQGSVAEAAAGMLSDEDLEQVCGGLARTWPIPQDAQEPVPESESRSIPLASTA
ncbi:MAG: hypothetical protein ABI968_09970 [Acidobacteriota bacterium]